MTIAHFLKASMQSLKRPVQLQYRSSSPGLILREYKHPEDISRIYTYSYLTEEPNNSSSSYLRRPIDPYDKPPTSPHFHRPHCKYFQWHLRQNICTVYSFNSKVFKNLFFFVLKYLQVEQFLRKVFRLYHKNFQFF